MLTLFYVALFPSTLAYLCFNRGVQLIGANRAAPFFHVVPVFGTVMSIVFLGEHPQAFHFVGFALVLTGVFVASRKPARLVRDWLSSGDLPRQIRYLLPSPRTASLGISMRARASNLMIGTLTLALIAGSLGAFLGYQKFAGIKQQVPFRVIFEGSASGLRKGGSVNFAGIRVGEVVSLKLDNPRRVVALTMIDGNTPVRSDTQVGLEFQGLTGIAAVSFTGGTVERRRRTARTAFPS